MIPVFACDTVEAKQVSPSARQSALRNSCFQCGLLSDAAEKHSPCQTQKQHKRNIPQFNNSSAQLLQKRVAVMFKSSEYAGTGRETGRVMKIR